MPHVRNVLGLSLSVLMAGCSVYSAIEQPSKKNMYLLSPGTHRDIIRAEFGTPVSTEKSYDVFRYAPGSSGWKYFRAFVYFLLDVATLTLAELITYPVEKGLVQDKDEKIRVHYDEALQVQSYEKL